MASRSAYALAGFVFSLIVFGSPVFTFVSIWNAASVQDYSFFPYPMMLLNCFIWMFYAIVLVHPPDNSYLIVLNAVGMVIAVTFVAIYIWFSDGVVRRNAVIMLIVTGVLGSLVVGLGFGWTHTVFSYAGVVSALVMYGSPLSIAWRVIQTASVENMSLFVAFASLAATSLWIGYAFTFKPYDWYIAIPNLGGLALAVAQLGLYGYYSVIYNRPENVVA